MPDPIRCRHIHTEGRQCGSPALRGEKLCYHHHAIRRPLARRADLSIIGPHLQDPEDLHAIQRGLAELLRLLSLDQLELKKAKLMLTTLAQAGTNLARIERNRRAARLLALAEARSAACHPEAAAQAGIALGPLCPNTLISAWTRRRVCCSTEFKTSLSGGAHVASPFSTPRILLRCCSVCLQW